MKTKLRLSIQLKLWKNDKLVYSATKRIKERVIAEAQVRMWDRAYIKVVYSEKQGLYNDGSYYSLDKLKRALSSFTESALLCDMPETATLLPFCTELRSTSRIPAPSPVF